MPSRKGYDQAITWLKSKMAEGDTLDAINAEVCYNCLIDLKEKRKVIGALYHQEHLERTLREEEKERLEYLFEQAQKGVCRFAENADGSYTYTISSGEWRDWQKKTAINGPTFMEEEPCRTS